MSGPNEIIEDLTFVETLEIIVEGPTGPGGTSVFSDDEIAAVTGAASPSASNVFATLADVGGGAVESVNGQTGVVVLDAGDVGAEPANANIQTHIGTTGNPHGTTAGGLGFTPSGNIAATNVQAAIEELDNEKPSAASVVLKNETVSGYTVTFDRSDGRLVITNTDGTDVFTLEMTPLVNRLSATDGTESAVLQAAKNGTAQIYGTVKAILSSAEEVEINAPLVDFTGSAEVDFTGVTVTGIATGGGGSVARIWFGA